MGSTADPSNDPSQAANGAPSWHERVARSLGLSWMAPSLAVAGLCVALLTQFSIIAGAAIPGIGLSFVVAGLLFGGAALSIDRADRSAPQEKPFVLTIRWELALLAAIVGLAAFFRFFRFTEFPPGLWYDEAINGTDALSIIDRDHLTVWRSSNFGHSTLYESPREKWRLQTVRGWSHDTTGEVSSGSARAGSTPGAGPSRRVSVAVGGDQLDCREVRHDAGDAAQVGAAS
jgi:hypothetical protein